jgi:hypothetical protein
MKFIKKEEHTKLRKALAAAYREKEKDEVGGLWQSRVMGHIRSLGPVRSHGSYLEPFERLFWRLAPLACILILVLGVAITKLDFVSDYEMSKILMEDPADFSLLTLFDS